MMIVMAMIIGLRLITFFSLAIDFRSCAYILLMKNLLLIYKHIVSEQTCVSTALLHKNKKQPAQVYKSS